MSGALLRAVALAAALAGAAGCAKAVSSEAPLPATVLQAAPAVLAPAWSEGDVSALRRRLAGALGASALSTSGIAIVDAGARPLFVRRERRPFAPASTFKLLSAVSALEMLGPDYRFETTFEALGPATDGILVGDLYLVGGGDPSLTADDLRAGVGALAAAGIRQITGGVVADGTAFGGREVNPAWDADDLQYGFAAGTSAVSLDGGTVEFHLLPTSPGAPARIEVRPPNDGIVVTGRVTTGYATSLSIERAPNANRFAFSGHIAVGAEQSFWRPVVDQPAYAANVARTMLERRGIAVGRPARAGLAPLTAAVLWRHRSEPLGKLLAHMLYESDNHYAEQLLRTLGASATDVGTEGSGGALERTVLRRLGVPTDGLQIVDGSGLAPTDRITPISLAMLLARAAADPIGPALESALPRVGIEGTVRRRDLTAGLGRVRAKSGHIDNVNALAGYVETRHHGRVAFAFVVNDRRADDGPVDDGIDRALDVLAEQ